MTAFSNEKDELKENRSKPRNFVTTQWSAVVRAADPSDPSAAASLETLCANYWMPLYLYVRRRGYSNEDGQDLTQGFFGHLIESNALEKASRDKGRFRTFLLSSLNNFMANDWHRQHALKRGGGQTTISIDQELAEERFHNEPATNESPDHYFDRHWAMTVMERAMKKVEAEMAVKGKGRQFVLLREFLAVRAGQSAYEGPAKELQSTTAAVAMMVKRMRQRYRDFIKAEVSETLSDVGDSDQEIQHLLAVVTSG